MTTYDLINFDPFKNFSIGFDRMFDSLNEVSRINTSNFPPYNIRKLGDDKYVKVESADFVDGILNIKLYQELPEEKKAKTIKIK